MSVGKCKYKSCRKFLSGCAFVTHVSVVDKYKYICLLYNCIFF